MADETCPTCGRPPQTIAPRVVDAVHGCPGCGRLEAPAELRTWLRHALDHLANERAERAADAETLTQLAALLRAAGCGDSAAGLVTDLQALVASRDAYRAACAVAINSGHHALNCGTAYDGACTCYLADARRALAGG